LWPVQADCWQRPVCSPTLQRCRLSCCHCCMRSPTSLLRPRGRPPLSIEWTPVLLLCVGCLPAHRRASRWCLAGQQRVTPLKTAVLV